MARAKVDLILHPVRFRIMLALVGKRLTAVQIARALPDVAQATLYRQLHRLVQGALVAIDETRPVRGGVSENVYSLNADQARLTPADVAEVGRDEHLRLFTIFFATTLREYERYLAQERIDVGAEVRYHHIPLYLSDEEFGELVNDFTQRLQTAQALPPTGERRRRLLSSAIFPLVDGEAGRAPSQDAR